MPVGQFDKPEPNKVIAALQRLGNQRPTGINLRVPRMSQDYLGTWLGPEAVDANLSLVRLHGGATIRFVPKMAGLTLVAGDIIKLQESSAIKLHIVGKIVGNITLAANATSNVAKPGAPTSYAHGTATSTTVPVTWSAGVDHFGSGLSYQIYVNGGFKQAVGTGLLAATITGLNPGTLYSSYVVAVDGAGNQSPNSSPTSFTTPGTPPPSGGSTVTKVYKAIGFRSYNYDGNNENDDWHNGNAYQGNGPTGQNQIGVIFFNDQAIRNDTAGKTMVSATVTITFAHWYMGAGGSAVVGVTPYKSGHAPGTINTSTPDNIHHITNRSSTAGKAFTVDMGVDIANDFRDGVRSSVSVGKGSNNSLTYYGYTYGLGTHVAYITLKYIA